MAYEHKITFKKEKTGYWDTSYNTQILYKKQEIGSIHGNDDGGWTARIRVLADEDHLAKNPNCLWMWVKVKQRFETEQAARDFLQGKKEEITKMAYFEKK